MDFMVNANSVVKVKLTEFGVSVLEAKHNELNEWITSRGGKAFEKFEVKVDQNGYYSTQIWNLMNDFGHVMSMGFEVPFHLDIIIENGEPVEGE